VPLHRFKPAVDPWAGASEIAPGVFAHPGVQIDPRAKLLGPLLVHPNCRIAAGAQVGPEVVLGQGVRIDTEAVATRAVLWDNTHLSPSERVEGAIAAPGVRLDAT
jgi:NDP-sugar pyrophosphorylase family protein